MFRGKLNAAGQKRSREPVAAAVTAVDDPSNMLQSIEGLCSVFESYATALRIL